MGDKDKYKIIVLYIYSIYIYIFIPYSCYFWLAYIIIVMVGVKSEDGFLTENAPGFHSYVPDGNLSLRQKSSGFPKNLQSEQQEVYETCVVL